MNAENIKTSFLIAACSVSIFVMLYFAYDVYDRRAEAKKFEKGMGIVK